MFKATTFACALLAAMSQSKIVDDPFWNDANIENPTLKTKVVNGYPEGMDQLTD